MATFGGGGHFLQLRIKEREDHVSGALLAFFHVHSFKSTYAAQGGQGAATAGGMARASAALSARSRTRASDGDGCSAGLSY